MSNRLRCIQVPHQGPPIAFWADDLGSLFDALTREFASREGEIFDELSNSADLIREDPEKLLELCREALAYDMQGARIWTEAEVLDAEKRASRRAIIEELKQEAEEMERKYGKL